MEILFSKKWSGLDFTKFVMPSILSMLTISTYVTVDMIFISRFVGPRGLAAVNIIMPLFSLFFGIGIMLAAGSSAIIGIELGENKKEKANQHFSLIFTFILFALAGLILSTYSVGVKKISLLLGASDTLLPHCMDYLRVFVFGMAAVMLKILFEYFMRLDGKPAWALYSTIISAITNIVLDYILMVHYKMGISGAGIASAVGIILAVLIGIFYFQFKSNIIKFSSPIMDFKFLKDSVLNGSSEMVSEFSIGIKTLVFNFVIIKYAGDAGIAALAILMQLYFLFSSIQIGLSMGITPVFSFNFGRKNFDKIQEIIRYTSIALLGTAVCTFTLSNFYGTNIIKLFTEEQSVMLITENGIKIFSFVFLVNGINLLASGFFTSMNNGKISALISFLNSFVFTLGFVAILPDIFNLNGVWLSIPAAESVTAALSVFLIMKYRYIYICPESVEVTDSTPQKCLSNS